jgi:predicted oxidoreductase
MTERVAAVRLGASGLKVSRIILGCMTYGNPEWQGWVLGEEEGIAHIKAAYDLGINTFDTADVRLTCTSVLGSRRTLTGGRRRSTRTACRRSSSAKRSSGIASRARRS